MDGKSKDIKKEQIEKLKSLFPEVVTEGNVDWEKLKLTLGEDVTIRDERYVLNWAGKSDAFRVLQQPTTAALAPDIKESIDFDKTENVFIEGENLEVLKVLQKSYNNKIKMIYIDPPYNTGNDSFIYPDKFSESKEEYLRRIGEKDEEGYLMKEGLFRKNRKENGQYHSVWMSMMLPRLFLARNLLRDDGVIFISIDDNEVHNLRMMMNEVFGEENFVAQFIWKSKLGKLGTTERVAINHEYIIGYSKNVQLLNIKKNEKVSEGDKERLRQWGQGDRREDRPSMFYPINMPNGKKVLPIKPDGSEGRWRVGKEKMNELIKQGLVLFKKQDDGRIEVYKKILAGTKTYSAIDSILSSGTGTTAEGSKDLKELFEKNIMDYPKPQNLIKYLASVICDEKDIIFDYFSGSSTTAHAVLELNKQTGIICNFICVQLPEKCDEDSEAYKAGYKTIADIGKERIRRVIKKIKKEAKENKDLFSKDKPQQDLGFKVFKLKQSNFKAWRSDVIENEKDLKRQMDMFREPVKPGADTDNMMWELLIKEGYELTTKVEKKELSKCPVYIAADGELIICLSKLTETAVKEIAKLKPGKVICLDSLFEKNDKLKTNTALQFKDAGVEFGTI